MQIKNKHKIRQPFRTLLPIAVWLLVWLIAAMVVNKTLLIPKITILIITFICLNLKEAEMEEGGQNVQSSSYKAKKY